MAPGHPRLDTIPGHLLEQQMPDGGWNCRHPPHTAGAQVVGLESAAGLVRYLEENNVEVYVDGGWAVDALLAQQTRLHDDLDIAVPHKHVPALRALLAARGFSEQLRDDTWECNFVLADEHGCRVDVHSYELDAAGNNIHGVAYIAGHLTGRGFINGYAVRCISPEWLVKFHTGYELDHNDYHDVRLLCERFGIALPAEFQKFTLSPESPTPGNR